MAIQKLKTLFSTATKITVKLTNADRKVAKEFIPQQDPSNPKESMLINSSFLSVNDHVTRIIIRTHKNRVKKSNTSMI